MEQSRKNSAETYTRKQIKEAFFKWSTEERLNPSQFIPTEEFNKMDVGEFSELQTKTLIDYINEN